MTVGYTQAESVYLVELKQVAKLATRNKIVSWQEIDAFEEDLRFNQKGIEGLNASSKDLIQKIENYIPSLYVKAC